MNHDEINLADFYRFEQSLQLGPMHVSGGESDVSVNAFDLTKTTHAIFRFDCSSESVFLNLRKVLRIFILKTTIDSDVKSDFE